MRSSVEKRASDRRSDIEEHFVIQSNKMRNECGSDPVEYAQTYWNESVSDPQIFIRQDQVPEWKAKILGRLHEDNQDKEEENTRVWNPCREQYEEF